MQVSAAESAPASTRPGGPLPSTLRLEFATEDGAREYLLALASLMFGSAESFLVVDEAGRGRDDLDLGEVAQRIRTKKPRSLQLVLRSQGEPPKIAIEVEPAAVQIRARVGLDAVVTEVLWLQADTEHLGANSVLALPMTASTFSVDSLHAFVALAARNGGFATARFQVDGEGAPRFTWGSAAPPAGAFSVVSSSSDVVWTACAAAPGSGTPAAWWMPSRVPPEPPPISADWWARFDDLVRAGKDTLVELENHLRALVPGERRWRLDDITAAHHAEFMAPAEDGRVLALVPRATEVVVSVDLHVPPEALKTLLLHALAHLALGHVRPGDRWGHWDTLETATAVEPHRQWDREARDFASSDLRRHVERRIESLDDCTPNEKAELGLWRMIGEMLGESRRLHPAAERYQKAAYQRQAAQRMLAMLEEHGGAMLCDGVGLGKTYVATTLVVHFANSWRDQWASDPDRLLEDPFRVTILAPNSVVSTWRREALPGLASFGVPLATVRVISHTKLSRMSRESELLEPVRGGPSDLEHLLLSDLVIVDEAHNFRSLAARRTKVLRDLVRLQPRREARRRVALLTATPVNNSLEDLRQEVSLLFSRPILLSDAKTDDGYRRHAVKETQDRCARARSLRARGDIASLVIHGQAEAKFSDAIEFRDELDFGPNVQRIGDYLREQDKRLKELQSSIRAAAQNSAPADEGTTTARIAEDLLDRIVVQRSRALCKEIERQQASNVELLFRPDAELPEKLHYSDEYDGIQDVLARFLPLFDGATDNDTRKGSPLSLKVYMWYDVREGIKSADETSSVVGLQRILGLKRLESSPVSFLITLLRLTVLHAHRLQQLSNICSTVGDKSRQRQVESEIRAILERQSKIALEKVCVLAGGEVPSDIREGFLKSVSKAYSSARPAADTDDPPPQLSLFEADEESGSKREQLDRLWGLREAITSDFETLLSVTPGLADIVFGKFARTEWPRRFIEGGESIDWPRSAVWGSRLVTDAKIRQLVGRLIVARRNKQKTIVFSQFSDTIAYVRSVLSATENFQRQDWQLALRGLGVPGLKKEELEALREATTAITGDTDDRDDVVNAFAPFYRIGPWRPAAEEATEAERAFLFDSWEAAWTGAMERGVDVLLSSDVLAEGVNLQDAALLINFDVHWNPVRMIQRSGRIDRRLNARIEQWREFPDLAALAARLGKSVPSYYWHDHPNEAPVTVNMILPDELEAELQLRERIATKTLAIDFTLGLEQGTGAEADWMASYKFHGINSLNSFQKDRAIEQVASHHERLARRFVELGVLPEWAENLNGWFRAADADFGSPLVARAVIGRQGGELERFRRYLEPAVVGGVPYWFWAEKKPGDSMFDGWLVLDGQTWPPPAPRRDIPWHENVAGPVKASHLLAAVEQLGRDAVEEWSKSNKGVGRLLQQGGSALAAPKFGEDRHLIRIANVFIIQLAFFVPDQPGPLSMRIRPTGPPPSRRGDHDDGASHAE